MTSTILIDTSILCILLDVVFFHIKLLKCPEEFQLWHYRVALSVYGTMEWLEQCPRESRCVSMNLNCSASVPGWWPCPVSSVQDRPCAGCHPIQQCSVAPLRAQTGNKQDINKQEENVRNQFSNPNDFGRTNTWFLFSFFILTNIVRSLFDILRFHGGMGCGLYR